MGTGQTSRDQVVVPGTIAGSTLARLRDDVRRIAFVCLLGSVCFGLGEGLATCLTAQGNPHFVAYLSVMLLSVGLSGLVWFASTVLFVAMACVLRLYLRITAKNIARQWPGVFACSSPPHRRAHWLLAGFVPAVLYVGCSALLTRFFMVRFRGVETSAVVLALLQPLLLGFCVALTALLVRTSQRPIDFLWRKLGRFSPFSFFPTALVFCALIAMLALFVVARISPVLRPELPWREVLACIFFGVGTQLAVYQPWRKRVAWFRTASFGRRRTILFASCLAYVLLLAWTLVWGGANPVSKGIVVSSSRPLERIIDLVRRTNDIDHDGYGSLLGENDCAPFNAQINPLARDLPDNGIDENCDGSDFERGKLPVYRQGQAPIVPAAFKKRFHVLFITIDTVRYDHTNMGGYHKRKARNTTPELKKLADRSVSFAFANAPAAGTMASIPSILTSKFFHSGIALDENVKAGMPPKLKKENVLISELFQGAGYRTGAILTHDYFNDWGMQQGFDTYDNEIGKKHEPFAVTSDRLTDKALAWLTDQKGGRPWFLWLHYLDPHGRYVAHPGDVSFGSTEEDLYDGELAYTDKELGRLLAEAERLGFLKDTIIVVTSDHGDAFNEHGFINHGQALYSELLHIPLIVYVPNIDPRVVEGPVSPMDILPTLAAILDIDPPADVLGESLVPQLFYGRDAKDRVVFSETNYPKPIRAVITHQYKLHAKLQDNLMEFYDLSKDPGEKNNLWPNKLPAEFNTIKGYLDDWLERVYYARDSKSNQAANQWKDVLLPKRPSPQRPMQNTFLDDGHIELLGSDLPGAVRPGQKVTFPLYFLAKTRPKQDFYMQVEFKKIGESPPVPQAPTPKPKSPVAKSGIFSNEKSAQRTVQGPATANSPLRTNVNGLLPTSRWRDGEIVKDTFVATVPSLWPQCEATVSLKLFDSTKKPVLDTTGSPVIIPLGTVKVAPGPPGGYGPIPP